MNRLTTDNPNGNTENALNLFYIKDKETWVRGGGPAPEYEDVRLLDYIRDIAKTHNLDIPDDGDEELADVLFELLFDGIGTIEGIVATLNTAAWAFSSLREKLKKYEDTGLTPEELMSLKTDEVIPAHWQDVFIAECENRLLILSCKVGDTVYMITYNDEVVLGIVIGFRYREKLVVDIEYNHHGTYATCRHWGETVFLTREEAEAALGRADNG